MKLDTKDWRTISDGVLELTRKEERRAAEQRREVDRDYINYLFDLLDRLKEVDTK